MFDDKYMQIARVRTPNRFNLVVYVQHSRGIISRSADPTQRASTPAIESWVFASSNYEPTNDVKLNFHQLLPYERTLIKVKYVQLLFPRCSPDPPSTSLMCLAILSAPPQCG